MNGNLKKILQLVLLGVCLFSFVMFVRQETDKRQGQDTYEDARSAALGEQNQTVQRAQTTQPAEQIPPVQEPRLPVDLWYPEPIGEDEHLQTLEQLDIAALQQTNPDVVGWIFVPGTEIDYPLMQGQDNEYYLNRTWQGKKNHVGSIFLEYRNSSSFSDFNTIVYGHNMGDGSMFADVTKFSLQRHFDKLPYLYIVLPEGILRYEVFAAYRAEVDSKTYGISFQQRQTRQEFIDHILEQSVVECDIVPQVTDRILTLSTCTGGGYSSRYVVHGRLKMIQVGG